MWIYWFCINDSILSCNFIALVSSEAATLGGGTVITNTGANLDLGFRKGRVHCRWMIFVCSVFQLTYSSRSASIYQLTSCKLCHNLWGNCQRSFNSHSTGVQDLSNSQNVSNSLQLRNIFSLDWVLVEPPIFLFFHQCSRHHLQNQRKISVFITVCTTVFPSASTIHES